MRIEISLEKSVEANASDYYDKSKKFKKKLIGSEKALKESYSKLRKLEQDKEKEAEIQVKQKREPVKKEWYEKFRWFISSEGFLVIGGRDATTNEIVIKKYAGKDDLVFHTDMIGSPFFVVKAEGKKPGKSTIKEAADATITFSRAFKLGLRTTPTFMAKPEQLTKEAKAGEYVPKGGFVTKGKLDYIDNKINIAVGKYNGRLMAGPLEAVSKNCDKYIVLEQGEEKPGKIVKSICYHLDCTSEDTTRVLPTGTFKILKIKE